VTYLSVLYEKLKEALSAVLPVTLIVLILNFTIAPVEGHLLLRFIIGAVFIIIGLTIFLFGVEIGITPIGSLMGKSLAKSNKLWVVAVGALLLGFIISVAEPDLHILASQVESVTSGIISRVSIVVIVSIGIGVMIALGLLRILFNIPLYKMLTVIYFIILGLGLFTSPEFLAIAFDASGATTGALTVPFMLAMALGVSALNRHGKDSEKDSFGLVAIASAGAIISVMMMSVLTNSDKITGSLETDSSSSTSVFAPFIHKIPHVAGEIFLALLPILVSFVFFQIVSFKLQKKAVAKIVKGLLYTFIGLTLFMSGVGAGFMEVGTVVGYEVASLGRPWLVVLVGFVLGLVVILAEPAVHVLTNQIEDVTSGYIKRSLVLFALSIGVAVAVALSMVRILVPEINLWHYLLPGYIIAVAMAQFAPKLFVGIAFDSGGVASGPMTATFVLAFAQGVAEFTPHADVLIDGFGVISMVALTPLIALQVLGFVFKIKSQKEV